MIHMIVFTPESLAVELTRLQGWSMQRDAIEKTFLFRDFNEALGFIVRVGLAAEQADHHPEIFNVYNNVVIRLNTHSAKAITTKDTDLAARIDQLVNRA